MLTLVPFGALSDAQGRYMLGAIRHRLRPRWTRPRPSATARVTYSAPVIALSPGATGPGVVSAFRADRLDRLRKAPQPRPDACSKSSPAPNFWPKAKLPRNASSNSIARPCCTSLDTAWFTAMKIARPIPRARLRGRQPRCSLARDESVGDCFGRSLPARPALVARWPAYRPGTRNRRSPRHRAAGSLAMPDGRRRAFIR